MAKAAWIAQQTDARLVRELFPVRKRDTHKGDYGKVLLLCGSEGLTGAARLAAKAALRTGSGLVYLGVPEKIYPIVAAASGSEIVFPLPCDGKGRLSLAALEPIGARMEAMDAVLLGPGLGRSEELTALCASLVRRCRVPLVLDADGINALAAHKDVLRESACPIVLTPHGGEFLRLGGDPLHRDPVSEAMRVSAETGCVVLLKGCRSCCWQAAVRKKNRHNRRSISARAFWRPAAARSMRTCRSATAKRRRGFRCAARIPRRTALP